METNNEDFKIFPERTKDIPLPDRERFTVSESNKMFLRECRERGYDISTIINLALETFQPKTKSNNFTWEGIENVVNGKRKSRFNTNS